MSQYNKGTNTRNLLLKTAKSLFFEQGYHATTTRQIAEKSNVNLGLIKYHFESKANIALAIYTELRDSFDRALLPEQYSDAEKLLIGSAVEFILCHNSPEFLRFYTEIYMEPVIHDLFQSKIVSLEHHNPEDEIFFRLHSVAFSFMKPSLIAYAATEEGKQIPLKQYILYYMLQQINAYHLGSPELAAQSCEKLQKFYFNVAANFTPVITKISD